MKILIIGKNGFIAKSLYELFLKNSNYQIYRTSKTDLDFLNKKEVNFFFNTNFFDILIFTPVYGGNRTIKDSNEIISLNINMYKNMIFHRNKFKLIFYFGSGASFNRDYDINNFDNNKLGLNIPKDPYGYSKYYIEKDLRNYQNVINLRIFNCFGINELNTRMIKANIINYIEGKNIIVHQDRYFDFIYIDDLFKIILNIIKGNIKKKEINCVYKTKHRISDIANIINNLSEKKVNIQILNNKIGNSYTGNYNYNYELNDFIGLEKGIKTIYEHILFNVK